MGGCCCCCASRSTELNRSPPFFHYPVSEEHEHLSPHNATVSALSTGLLVDTNLDTSVPDTYQPPPPPIPYETYIGYPPTQSVNREGSINKGQVALQTTNTESVEDANAGSTLETKVMNLASDEKAEQNIEPESEQIEDEISDELKKSSKDAVLPVEDDDDTCPICLEEYDAENPKLITKCDHHFHLACILEWMERSDTCPVCNQEMDLSPVFGV